MKFKQLLPTTAIVAAMAFGTVSPALAHPNQSNQSGGAAGVVAAVVQVDRTLNDLVDVDLTDVNVEVITVKDSLNNVLQNARFLNNIDILRNSTFLNDILNNADIDVNVEDVLAIDVLSDGTIIVYRA